MRIFALGTGHNGSSTFARAASHATNFTAGHETRSRIVGAERFAYPDQQIESDNRLSWHLGMMDVLRPDALYVHLTRSPEQAAASFVKRWDAARPSLRKPKSVPLVSGGLDRCAHGDHARLRLRDRPG